VKENLSEEELKQTLEKAKIMKSKNLPDLEKLTIKLFAKERKKLLSLR